jgi:glycosyltransferase involved in cell wall biosynthesis
MDPGVLVPPIGYGGHERLVHMFATYYQTLGHEVHLLVTRGSFVEKCKMHVIGDEGLPQSYKQKLGSVIKAWKFLFEKGHQFDLIHNFGRLLYLLPVVNNNSKKIMTYGREISFRNIDIFTKLPSRKLIFTGCSNDLISRNKLRGNWKIVYNAIEFNRYELQEKVNEDAPLIFLGRLERIKGCHTAIQVAKATNNKLIIAGNISTLPEENQYYLDSIAPYIDGEQIKYVGQVNDIQKNSYLGSAKALLFPIEWNEPFGMVMVEAMACGTPVIAFKKGSVDEIVDEGITGLKVENITEMIKAVDRAIDIDRPRCRERAKERFNISVIGQKYLDL